MELDVVHELSDIGEEQFKRRAPVASWLMNNKLKHEFSGNVTVLNVDTHVQFTETSLPLPVVWKSFKDFALCEVAARRVAEGVEKMLLGAVEPWKTGEFNPIYGFLTFPRRLKVTDRYMTLDSITKRVERAISCLNEVKFFGPYCVVYGADFDAELDDDAPGEQDKTLREVLLADEKLRLQAMLSSDHLPSRTLVVFQATPDVVRMVVGQKLVCSRWDDEYRWLTVTVPQLRADFHGNCGVCVVED